MLGTCRLWIVEGHERFRNRIAAGILSCMIAWFTFASPAAAHGSTVLPQLWTDPQWSARLQTADPDADSPLVQIFDVEQERVLTTRQNSSAFRHQVELWIEAAEQLSGRSRLETDSGLVVRIPLQPPLSLNRAWLQADISEAYLFLDPKSKALPFLLLISREGKPYVLDIKEQPQNFLKEQGLLRYLKK